MRIGGIVAGLEREGGAFCLARDGEAGTWVVQLALTDKSDSVPAIARSAVDAVRLAVSGLGWELPDEGLDISILVEGLARESGSFVLIRDEDWLASLMFGQEAPDSPMVGGAADGVGLTAQSALSMMIEQTGWDRRESVS